MSDTHCFNCGKSAAPQTIMDSKRCVHCYSGALFRGSYDDFLRRMAIESRRDNRKLGASAVQDQVRGWFN